jgi:hypothetical protein
LAESARLIDPVGKGITFAHRNPKITGNVDRSWLGVRDTTLDDRLDWFFFPLYLPRSPDKEYHLTHTDTGFDVALRQDLLTAAKAAGVKFNK